MNLTEYSDVLAGIRSIRKDCKKYGNPVRFIYWPNEFGKGAGVSFVDPEVEPKGDFCAAKIRRRLMEEKPRVLSIGSAEKSDLIGYMLSSEVIQPFFGYTVVKRSLVDQFGRPLDPIVLCWVDKTIGCHDYEWETDDGYGNYTTHFDSSFYNVIKDYAYNDYTNRAFNYFYIKKLSRDKELAAHLSEYEFFTDGERVSKEFGYSSPAYAVALYKSLSTHGILETAWNSFESFLHFHPYDQIVADCENRAARRFGGGRMANANDPIEEIKNENVDIYRDENYDDDIGHVYYVDDSPVYGCGSQEEAEIEYWNTH